MGSESSECAWSNSNLRWFGHQSRLVRGPLGALTGLAAIAPWSTGHFAADATCAFTSDFASDVNSVPLLAIESLLSSVVVSMFGFSRQAISPLAGPTLTDSCAHRAS